MKKLLLILPLTTALTACGSDNPEQIAHDYCVAIKTMKFENAKDIAMKDVLRSRERKFEKNKGKYSQLFASQSCEVTNVENVGERNGKPTLEAYFGGSKLDSVYLEYSDRNEQYYIVSDAFKHDLQFYQDNQLNN